jgi:hypothetical protein
VTVNSHALSSSFHPGLTILLCGINACFPSISTGQKLPAKRKYANHLVNCPVSVHLYTSLFVSDSVCVLPFIFKIGCIRYKNTLREGFTDGTFLNNNKPTWRPDFGADFIYIFLCCVDVIHTVSSNLEDVEVLESCYSSCLRLVKEHELSSVVCLHTV